MLDISKIEIDFDGATKETIKYLKTLLTTPKGTVTFDREFGLNYFFLDQPIEIAKGYLTVEIIEKVKSYIEDVKVDKVEFMQDKDKNIYSKVVLTCL